MKNAIVALGSLCLMSACGMGNESAVTGEKTDSLYAMQLGDGTLVTGAQHDRLAALEGVQWQRTQPLPNLERAELCSQELIRPIAMGTIQSIPRLGVFGLAPVGSEVQSSYFRSNSVNEEFRKGIAEFWVEGQVAGAVLQFREHRGWTSYPLPADTHLIEVYPANLEVEPDDFSTRAVLVGKFESDPNLEPSFANSYDVTKAVQEVGGGRLGVRFSIEGGIGSGTSFMDLALEVTRCRQIARPGY